jgi:hypothetical protein
MNEDLACKKVLNCTDVTKLKTIGKYLSEMRCKWENKASKTQLVLEASGNRNGTPTKKKIIGKRSKYTVVTVLVKVVVVVQGPKRRYDK